MVLRLLISTVVKPIWRRCSFSKLKPATQFLWWKKYWRAERCKAHIPSYPQRTFSKHSSEFSSVLVLSMYQVNSCLLCKWSPSSPKFPLPVSKGVQRFKKQKVNAVGIPMETFISARSGISGKQTIHVIFQLLQLKAQQITASEAEQLYKKTTSLLITNHYWWRQGHG